MAFPIVSSIYAYVFYVVSFLQVFYKNFMCIVYLCHACYMFSVPVILHIELPTVQLDAECKLWSWPLLSSFQSLISSFVWNPNTLPCTLYLVSVRCCQINRCSRPNFGLVSLNRSGGTLVPIADVTSEEFWMQDTLTSYCLHTTVVIKDSINTDGRLRLLNFFHYCLQQKSLLLVWAFFVHMRIIWVRMSLTRRLIQTTAGVITALPTAHIKTERK